ncbi:MAG TPA: hypothetical protein VJ865_02535 [Gemmatimonadaceae bacterium]|nr:hypothetical protein [Gemmatimonadaceae bacterium]
MTASLLYRISSVILALFAVGHTIGFRQVDPRWGADTVVSGMRTVSFEVQAFNRTYWDFFTGFGIFVTVFLLFAAILAWRFGSMTPERLAAIPVERWSFAVCFVLIAALTWRYFFLAPGVLSTLAALGLVGAAWLGG